MRRQTKPQGLAARWPVRPLDVDPFHLPARFVLPVCSPAGGQVTQDNILITSQAVAVEHNMPGALRRIAQVAVKDFQGVAIRIDRLGDGPQAFAISVNLQHDEPDFCIPLHMAFDMCDASARWQSWGRALSLPLLMPTPDGGWREPDEVPGRMIVREAFRRHPRLALKQRRSLMSAVREVGRFEGLDVLPGDEIIARN